MNASYCLIRDVSWLVFGSFKSAPFGPEARSQRQAMESSRPRATGGIPCSAGAPLAKAAAAKVGRMRIVDFLSEPDEPGDEIGGSNREMCGRDSSVSSDRASRRSLSGWLSSFTKRPFGGDGGKGEAALGSCREAPLLRRRQRKRKEGREETRDDGGTEEAVAFDSKSAEAIDGGAGVHSLRLPTGGNPGEMSFGLGMGIGMAFFLSRWEIEFNKMKELKLQMEIVLQEITNEVTKKDVASRTARPNQNVASLSDCTGKANECNIMPFRNEGTNFPMEDAKSTVESEEHTDDQISTEKQRMDQLEAELVLELEQLQLRLDGEESVRLTNGMTSSESCPAQEDYNIRCGVAACELERKLYEVIHKRQQERIQALESALELTNQMLVDKEAEVSWWRDAISFTSEHNEEMLLANSHGGEYNLAHKLVTFTEHRTVR